MAEFAARHRKFLPLVDTDETWVHETIDDLQDVLDGTDGVWPFGPDVCGATKVQKWHVPSRALWRAGAGQEGGGSRAGTRRSRGNCTCTSSGLPIRG